MKKIAIITIALIFVCGNLLAQNGGNVLDLDGDGDYVEFYSAPLYPGVNFTFEAWIKTSSADNENEILGWGHFFEPSVTEFRTQGGKLEFGISDGNTWESVLGNNDVNTGNWTHVAVTYGNYEVKLYVDGVLDATGIIYTYPSEIGIVCIGSLYQAGTFIPGYEFPGQIDEVRIWDYAQDATEIAANMYASLNGDEAGLLGLWHMDEAPGTGMANDASIYYNNGYLQGDADFWDPSQFHPPTGLTATAEDAQIELNWNANSESYLKLYRIYSHTADDTANAALIDSVEKPNTTYTHTGLTNRQTYYYWLSAVDSSGNETDWTAPVSATPQELITFTLDLVASYGIRDVSQSSVAWGDYNSDGYLDILMMGDSSGSKTSTVYHNQSGFFYEISPDPFGLTMTDGSVAWGDYDNDGDLDVLLTGYVGAFYRYSKVFRNDEGTFIDIEANLTHVYNGSAAWGDYDNDGDLDILLTGYTGLSNVSGVYRNDGGIFTDISANLPNVSEGSAAWGDYDNDGDLDILLTGSGTTYSSIYRNDGGIFTDIVALLLGIQNGSVAWGDYDNDGDLDILITGRRVVGSDPISKVYRNDAGTFTDISADIINVQNSSVAWGDYDNDGDLDILLTGDYDSNPISKIYRNDAGTFFDISANLTGVSDGSVAWGDYDNDGDLDVLLTGHDGSNPIAAIYENNMSSPNTAPDSPTNLSAVIGATGEYVELSWDPATDAETFDNRGLTYNIYLGTDTQNVDVSSPMADLSDGYRKIAAIGNTNHNTTWSIKGLSPGVTYYWSVQAIDGGFKGSAFAGVESFTSSLGVDIAGQIPDKFALKQNYPNPFNPVTTLRYNLPEQTRVTLVIYDLLGREVKTLVNRVEEPGFKTVIWNATDNTGQPVSAGIYLYRISSEKYKKTNKMVLLK